jgi:glyoxylase-like metal-dependent hydrolase (beta-lactamase superfamily II)
MRLTDDVVLAGGGTLTGFGVSADFDAHVYLLNGGDGQLALIDCGMGTATGMERLLANVAAAGLDPSRIARLFLTHYHTDHAGGAARYRERLGLAVAISSAAADALERGDHEATSFRAARELGIFPSDFEYPPCPVDDRLEDGDLRQVGRLTLRFVATPGHAAGHGSYLVTGGETTYLFAGDAVFAGGKIFLQATADCDLQASLESVRRLAALDFDAFLPGHGSIALRDGRAHVEAAKAAIDRLAVPPSLV